MRALSLALVTSLAIFACGGEADPTPTGSTCPPDSTLTYENFGADFMEAYCTRCHSRELIGLERHGAPDDHNFDPLEGILDEAEHVDSYAAAGPDATNTLMPPSGDSPSEDERRDLGEWIACELANP